MASPDVATPYAQATLQGLNAICSALEAACVAPSGPRRVEDKPVPTILELQETGGQLSLRLQGPNAELYAQLLHSIMRIEGHRPFVLELPRPLPQSAAPAPPIFAVDFQPFDASNPKQDDFLRNLNIAAQWLQQNKVSAHEIIKAYRLVSRIDASLAAEKTFNGNPEGARLQASIIQTSPGAYAWNLRLETNDTGFMQRYTSLPACCVSLVTKASNNVWTAQDGRDITSGYEIVSHNQDGVAELIGGIERQARHTPRTPLWLDAAPAARRAPGKPNFR